MALAPHRYTREIRKHCARNVHLFAVPDAGKSLRFSIARSAAIVRVKNKRVVVCVFTLGMSGGNFEDAGSRLACKFFEPRLQCFAKCNGTRFCRDATVLRDNPVGSSHQYFENPCPAGAELSLTEDVTSQAQAQPGPMS